MMIEVRPILKEDHPAILALVETLPEWFDSDARSRAIPADLRRQDGFVALSKREVVGFISLFFAEGRLNIGWLGVRPDSQGKGIGSRLLVCAEEFARHHGLTEIATYTLGEGVAYEPYEATRRFYFNRGFTIYQRNTSHGRQTQDHRRVPRSVER